MDISRVKLSEDTLIRVPSETFISDLKQISRDDNYVITYPDLFGAELSCIKGNPDERYYNIPVRIDIGFSDISTPSVLVGIKIEDGFLAECINRVPQEAVVNETLNFYDMLDKTIDFYYPQDRDGNYHVLSDISREDIRNGRFNLEAILTDENFVEPCASLVYEQEGLTDENGVSSPQFTPHVYIGCTDSDGNAFALSIPLTDEEKQQFKNELNRRIDLDKLEEVLKQSQYYLVNDEEFYDKKKDELVSDFCFDHVEKKADRVSKICSIELTDEYFNRLCRKEGYNEDTINELRDAKFYYRETARGDSLFLQVIETELETSGEKETILLSIPEEHKNMFSYLAETAYEQNKVKTNNKQEIRKE